jgi:hypothetical protein
MSSYEQPRSLICRGVDIHKKDPLPEAPSSRGNIGLQHVILGEIIWKKEEMNRENVRNEEKCIRKAKKRER